MGETPQPQAQDKRIQMKLSRLEEKTAIEQSSDEIYKIVINLHFKNKLEWIKN